MLVAFGGAFTAQTPSPSAPAPTQEPAAPPVTAAPPAAQTPPELVSLVDLPRADDLATRELVESLVSRFEVLHGYRAASEDQSRQLPVPPRVTAVGGVLARTGADHKTLLLRFGFLRQAGQLPQLWSAGLTLAEPGVPNPDTALLGEALAAIKGSRQAAETVAIPFGELERRVIRLGHIDVDDALSLLKAMGYNVIPNGVIEGAPGEPPRSATPVDPAAPPVPPPTVTDARLPMVLKIPGPSRDSAGVVGKLEPGAASPTSIGIATSQTLGATPSLPSPVTSPSSQLMVMFNPARPEQYARLLRDVTTRLDVPARQVLIEALVIEITKDALDKLGVQWDLQAAQNSLILGKLANDATPSVTGTHDSSTVLNPRTLVTLQALVQQGQAEVLARPSVLTLDNRQAVIRVGTDIPLPDSNVTPSVGGSIFGFSFKYLPVGIQLNVRPRVDVAGNEVGMLIDATVSAVAPNQDLEVLDDTTKIVLARAPTVVNRRVQTYARIHDDTPLIIGGLISRDTQELVDKVPLLGNLPFFGNFFKARQTTSTRHEVIIVLTPYILPEDHDFAQIQPQQGGRFDALDNDLLPNSYRLRDEDMADTGFIRSNPRLLASRALVERMAETNAHAAEAAPFSLVRGGHVPGEQILVVGMLYETLVRQNFGSAIPVANLELLAVRSNADVGVIRLSDVLTREGDGKNARSFFSLHPDQCVALTFRRPKENDPSVLIDEEPDVTTVPCAPDRSDWAARLLEMNQPGADGAERHTVLIKDDADLERLSRAVLLYDLMRLNGGDAFTLENFAIGRVVAIPRESLTRLRILQPEIARIFFYSAISYTAFQDEFERTMSLIEKALRGGRP
jgi:general secretion pathway protein D